MLFLANNFVVYLEYVHVSLRVQKRSFLLFPFVQTVLGVFDLDLVYLLWDSGVPQRHVVLFFVQVQFPDILRFIHRLYLAAICSLPQKHIGDVPARRGAQRVWRRKLVFLLSGYSCVIELGRTVRGALVDCVKVEYFFLVFNSLSVFFQLKFFSEYFCERGWYPVQNSVRDVADDRYLPAEDQQYVIFEGQYT